MFFQNHPLFEQIPNKEGWFCSQDKYQSLDDGEVGWCVDVLSSKVESELGTQDLLVLTLDRVFRAESSEIRVTSFQTTNE